MSRNEKALGGRLRLGVDDRLRLSHGGRLYREDEKGKRCLYSYIVVLEDPRAWRLYQDPNKYK
jgi:hypothetical protein